MKTKNIVIYGLLLAAGICLGWLLFGGSDGHSEHQHDAAAEAQTWTCSMHPQIRQDKPGKCPLCAMDLIPVQSMSASVNSSNPNAVVLSKEALALADIQTMTASYSSPVKEIRLYGTIQPNANLFHSQVSHVSGRIERLSVNFAGETVREGQVIAGIYSPDLLNAQQELLEAVKMQNAPLLDAAREKLRLWKMTDAQIAAVEQSGTPSPVVDITAGSGGVVVEKNVSQGDYVSTGSTLFTLTDLSSVWAVFEAYESDLPHLKTGDKVRFTVQALPEKDFSGKITFINPTLDKTTRTVKIRVEAANAGMQLKPEMYANAFIQTAQGKDKNAVVIPKTAVLWTGKRSIVYVKEQDSEMPAFALREIELGAYLGDACIVLSGIDAGEEIVVNGAFTIDAAAQLEGKASMMNTGKAEAMPEKSAEPVHAMLEVGGLCGMCKTRIEGAAMSVVGVTSASWDKETRQLHLHFDPSKTALDDISKAVAKSGHDTDKHKADDGIYNALPACCKYRK
ncbi:MAG: efflux RND transporter periplasmic adaptor subunit [Bacteroidales bacterium]|jgi:Cu(I)/Ag(I) efflux system membrane fusion protein|nr:efflux RND transporter periplasmic adaptor subunit [Bacteroidales bacterium]